MRIGVLTYHCPPNFGAQLQAVSSVGFLRQAGHEVYILNWYAKDLEEMYSQRIPAEQISCHNRFAESTLPLTNKCQKEEELIETIESLNLDAIIAGSDALFKYIPLNKYRHFSKRKFKYIYNFKPLSCEQLDGNPFFGAFLGKLQNRIPASTYAVSSQNCPFSSMTRSEKRAMREAMSNYKLITVRDNWTKRMVENITNRKNILIFPDPVFSFNTNCYLPIPTKEETIRRYNLNNDYVLLSFSSWHTNQEYIFSIAEEVKRRNLQPVALPMPEKLFAAGIDKQIDLPISPLDWYALIIHSKGFIGERMHPIVVCLHNAIPFFSFDEYGIKVKKGFFSKELVYNPSSSKTYSIVSEAGLLENLYSYKGASHMPSPQHVVNMLIYFDTTKCKSFAFLKRDEYQKGMNAVLDSLI